MMPTDTADTAFLQALDEEITADVNSAVNLAQTRATFVPGGKRVRGGGDWNFAAAAAMGAFTVIYLTHTPFDEQHAKAA